MNSHPFRKMFDKCTIDDTYGEVLVENVQFFKDDKTMRLQVRFEHFPGATGIRELSRSLSIAYGLNGVEIVPRYGIGELSRESVRVALGDSILDSPAAAGIMDGCKTHVSGAGVRFTLKHGGADFLTGFADELSQRLFEVFGESIPVSFENAPQPSEETGDGTLPQSRRDKIISEMKKVVPIRVEPSKLIYGKRPSERFIPIDELEPDAGRQTIRGKVFATNHRDKTRRGTSILSFDMCDDNGAARVVKQLRAEDAGILSRIRAGMHVSVSGRFSFNEFERDVVLEPDGIAEATAPPMRTDNAEVKRVELHLHTKMSTMDAVIDPSDAVRRAASWGHRAVAITDHGNVQAFPDVMQAAAAINRGREDADKIKVIYGMEAYFVNDIERVRAVYGNADLPLDGEFVAFDIETTGLAAASDRIIEIGAVIFKGGKIVDTFNTFVDPMRKIPQNIVQLTGIDDSMVRGAPKISAAMEAFLEFIGDRVLVAHNANFDIGFIAAACRANGFDFAPTYIDTRNMARGLLLNINRFDLSSVAKELNIPKFNHHRASDDAGAVAEICIKFFDTLMLAEQRTTGRINEHLATISARAGARLGGSNHMILLTKNQTGLRNLYDLVSLANLEYFQRHPLIPRSALDKHREGLLVGSACESGELFRAIVDWKSDSELERIASYYDFLEVQPIGNNEFLLRNGKAKNQEELQEYNRVIVGLGEKLNKPVVATCDVHFMEPEDECYRRVLMSDFNDGDNQAPLYFRTTAEMLEEFAYLGEKKALEVVVINPNEIADMCEHVSPVKSGTYSPVIENSDEELKRLVYGKLQRLYGDNPLPEIVERVEFEMNSIIGNKFDVIYIIAQKLIARSLEEGYLVGSRGSVGSSVVAFLADITEVNALPPHYRCPNCKHHEFSDQAECGADLKDKDCPECGTPYEKDGFDILFATFLGFEGDKKPDIDLNFSGEYQSRAHEYTIELFGEGHVFRAGTIGTLAEKNAYGYVKKYAEKRNLSLSKAEENRLTQGIVGVKKTTGQHPGGLIIVPKGNDIREFTPIQRPADRSDSNIITTHFDFHSIEENLLKLDELGHDDPTIIKMLQDLTGIDPQKIPLDDKKTISLFTSTEALGFVGDPIVGQRATFAVPEFGTKFVRDMLSDTKPTTFNELLRISGLSHGTNVWLGNAKDYIDHGIATLKDVVGARDDISLFLMNKGIEPKQAFNISEAVRKGKGLTADFEEKMRRAGVPEWYIESCKKIKYLFPKAHAAAYVIMAFRIAWYKVHAPLAFYCAYFSVRAKILDAKIMTAGIERVRSKLTELYSAKEMTARDGDLLTTLEVVYEFYRRGFDFRSIDLYESDAIHFKMVDDATIIPPFTAIPGFGELAAREIVAARKDGIFISAEDIMRRCPKVGNAAVELLDDNGALSGMPKTNQISLF